MAGRRAGIDAGVARRALGCIAERSLCHQAARIDGPEGYAGLDGRIDGSVQLGLVVDAIEPQAAGKVDERFLLVKLAKHFGRGLQGGELPVGIEDVELAVVLAECRAGVGAACVVHVFGGSWPSPTIMVSRMLSR